MYNYKIDENICTENGSLQAFNEVLNHYVESIITVVGQPTS